MRHKKRTVKLGRMSSHRKAMLSNMAASVVLHKKVQTTLPKARAVVPVVDKLIRWSKRGTLHDRRLAFSILKDRDLVGKLFTEIAPEMASRNGGYSRITKTGYRKGDNAPLAIVEIVGFESTIEVEPKSKKKKKEKS